MFVKFKVNEVIIATKSIQTWIKLSGNKESKLGNGIESSHLGKNSTMFLFVTMQYDDTKQTWTKESNLKQYIDSVYGVSARDLLRGFLTFLLSLHLLYYIK